VPNITFSMDGARDAYETELRYASSATGSPRPANSFGPSKVLRGPATATPRPDSAVTVGSVRASWKPEPIARHRWISGESHRAEAPPSPSPSKEPPDFLDRAGLFAPIPAVAREKPRNARSAAAEPVGPRVLVERLITRASSAMRGGAVTSEPPAPPVEPPFSGIQAFLQIGGSPFDWRPPGALVDTASGEDSPSLTSPRQPLALGPRDGVFRAGRPPRPDQMRTVRPSPPPPCWVDVGVGGSAS